MRIRLVRHFLLLCSILLMPFCAVQASRVEQAHLMPGCPEMAVQHTHAGSVVVDVQAPLPPCCLMHASSDMDDAHRGVPTEQCSTGEVPCAVTLGVGWTDQGQTIAVKRSAPCAPDGKFERRSVSKRE